MWKLVNLLIIIGAIGLFIATLDYFSPFKVSSLLTGQGALQESACFRAVNVSDGSMEPTLKKGSTVNFNKCIDDVRGDLESGTIVLVEPFLSGSKIRVIGKKIVGERGISYSVTTLKNKSLKEEVKEREIKGVYMPPF